jgi:hypothetical protein
LVYVSGEDLILQTLRIPDPLHKHLRPRYNLALHKENPAMIASQRMQYIDKIKECIKFYDVLRQEDISKEATLRNLESCSVLMQKRLLIGFANKRLVVQNKEFLRL